MKIKKIILGEKNTDILSGMSANIFVYNKTIEIRIPCNTMAGAESIFNELEAY